MAVILKSKMAAIQKNGTKANFVPWVIWTKQNFGSKNVAEIYTA